MEDLKLHLMKLAREKGICIDGYSEMRTDDIDALIDYYINNPDWCLERDYPTLDFLKKHFSGIEDKGVFVGKTFNGEILNERQVYIFHNCKGTVKVGLNVEFENIPMLYVANKCRLRFVGIGDIKPNRESGRTQVPVYIFGKNDVSAHDNMYVVFNKINLPMI